MNKVQDDAENIRNKRKIINHSVSKIKHKSGKKWDEENINKEANKQSSLPWIRQCAMWHTCCTTQPLSRRVIRATQTTQSPISAPNPCSTFGGTRRPHDFIFRFRADNLREESTDRGMSEYPFIKGKLVGIFDSARSNSGSCKQLNVSYSEKSCRRISQHLKNIYKGV